MGHNNLGIGSYIQYCSIDQITGSNISSSTVIYSICVVFVTNDNLDKISFLQGMEKDYSLAWVYIQDFTDLHIHMLYYTVYYTVYKKFLIKSLTPSNCIIKNRTEIPFTLSSANLKYCSYKFVILWILNSCLVQSHRVYHVFFNQSHMHLPEISVAHHY